MIYSYDKHFYIGHARVITRDQNMDLQIDASNKVGCEIIFQEKISSKSKERPELIKLFEKLRKGETVLVRKLDRSRISRATC
ncbi:recombinase family protein [Pedobacter sp. W3I1]|uniref:recombinase family protein n=1 Tax=Pedobacter sp. W3I1 TaxID=3042291 RepID=UPI0035946ACA